MEPYEDDEDTHYCIKCHTTINGLDNYVRHRQAPCRAPEAKQSEVPAESTSNPTTVTYPEILNADAFFSSLELQSSSKSNQVPRPRGLVERKYLRSDERAKRKARRTQETEEKEKLLNMPPVVADLDDLMDHLGIPSLVGFPDIVATPKTSATATPGKSSSTQTSAKIGNHENLSTSPAEGMISSKVCVGNSNNDRKTETPRDQDQDNGNWLDLDDLDGNNENNKEPEELASYNDYEYQPDDEESDMDSPEDDLDDEDSYSNDEETEDHDFLAAGRHTGGKWKPSELEDVTRSNEDEFADDEDHEHPPPTGGKWKPAEGSNAQRHDEVTGKDPGASSSGPAASSGGQAPPGHTRGKWIPGAHGEFGSGYWCDSCGRKLASKLLYNRHLLSDLHARRSIQEIDGDLQLPRGAGPLLQRKSASKRQTALAEIKSKSKIPASQDENKETRKKSRRRQKEVLLCEMCQTRVRRPQMGKHLLSHYHCRVAGTNPCSNPAARRFILENMGNVVRQCPFQCAICRFYCNTEETFLLHWRSSLHTSKFDHFSGNYKCTPCDFDCSDNGSMEVHLLSLDHREVVAMMNGSVPVVIGKQRSLNCENCNQTFRYNVQLRMHIRETGHRGSETAFDEYQSRMTCNQCWQVLRSLVALQRHQLACHGQEKESKDDEETKIDKKPSAPYFCSFCSLNFITAKDAILHRRTASHKEIVRIQKSSAENQPSFNRECPHCGSNQSSLLHHKEHLLQQHPELCHRCPRCGLRFALPQDVTRHTRDVNCIKPVDQYLDRATSHDGEWRCNNCSFVTDSQAEFLFHDVLHIGAISESQEEPSCSKSSAKYRCPLCEKLFCKVTLRNHIRYHTGEKPFRCFKCKESFSRRSSLNAHRKECTSSNSPSLVPKDDAEPRRRIHNCSECNTSFYTNHIESYYGSSIGIYTKRRWFRVTYYTKVDWGWKTRLRVSEKHVCCTGYDMVQEEPLSCVPKCSEQCIDGTCVGPDLCKCNEGYHKPLFYSTGRFWEECKPLCTDVPDSPDGCEQHATCRSPNRCVCFDGYVEVEPASREAHLNDKKCVPHCDEPCVNGICRFPNECECNSGYEKASDFICMPVCSYPCENGTCIAPDQCQCYDGFEETGSIGVCSPVCYPPCVNAMCTSPNHCECDVGYEVTLHESPEVCSPICDPPCMNATCVQPNDCECHGGFSKLNSYSSEICFPDCYPSCVNSECVEPDVCSCHPGFSTSQEDSPHSCSPICDPPCINATCVEPNICQCNHGFTQVSEDACSPICDPPCINATCVGPNDCHCHDGFAHGYYDPVEMCSPVCDPPCVNANCVEPNRCSCDDGFSRADHDPPEVCSPICDPPCINGNCIEPYNCQCHSGFSRPHGSESYYSLLAVCLPVCDPPCVNATCVEPNRCSCKHGFSRADHDPPEVCSPICDPPCINGNCIEPHNCQCHRGFSKAHGFASHYGPPGVCSPVCDPPCVNATCVEPNRCSCNHGFSKADHDPPEVCSPICDPPCINATCVGPNNCHCHDGFSHGHYDPVEMCSPVCDPPCVNATCVEPNRCSCNHGFSRADHDPPEVCSPICDPPCINGNCIEPHNCQCHHGFSRAHGIVSHYSPPGVCSPVCDPPCINATCVEPNVCHCNPGYKANDTERPEICTPVCDPPCINATCTEPNSCKCNYGYEKSKILLPMGLSLNTNSTITSHVCVPSCEGGCLNGHCVAPNVCICKEGYISGVLPGSTESGYYPVCESNTETESDSVMTTDSQSSSIDYQSTSSSQPESSTGNAVNLTSTCSNDGTFLENGTCICAHGWSGLTCDEPSFCTMDIIADNETLENISIALRYALRQHTLRHAGKKYKCGLPGCPTILRTENELKSHRLLVHETGSSERQFRCGECPYAAKTRTQLRRHQTRHENSTDDKCSTQLSCPYSHCNFKTKAAAHLNRHVRLHTGKKPYRCRHCEYASNNLENLRKHVLLTTLHPGKTIYECDICNSSDSGNTEAYCTNFAKELRAHLLEAHPRDFPRPSDATDHVAKIFGTDREPASPTPDVNNPYEDSITAPNERTNRINANQFHV